MGDISGLFDTLGVTTRPRAPGQQIGTDDVPMSPWGQRYGQFLDTNPILKDGEVRHSGYITGHPRLDPKFFGDVIPPQEFNTCGHFRHPNDIARYFFIEHGLALRAGFKPWHHAPWNQYVVFSPQGLLPGGHWRTESKPYAAATPEKLVPPAYITQVTDEGRIQVDENTWFPFFQRHRWYNISRSSRHPGETVNLDDPKLWGALSLSIEVANRVLLALVNDQHPTLHTLLFGKLAYWNDLALVQPCPAPFPNAKVLLSYERCKSLCDANNEPCPVAEPSAYTPADWARALAEFGTDLTWGVSPFSAALGKKFDSGPTIVIHSRILELLSGGDVTLAEQCHLAYRTADAIIHELSHAVTQIRLMLEFPPTPTQDYQFDEPFIDFGPVAEMGFAVTTGIFGGILRAMTPKNAGEKPYPVGMKIVSWPPESQRDGQSNWGYKIGSHPSYGQGTTQEIVWCPLPALFSAKMLSRYFWEDPGIPRKSDNFFHRNVIFSSRTSYPTGRLFNYQPIQLSSLSDFVLAPGEREMVESWQVWRSLWESMQSGWYTNADRMWRDSPWAEIRNMYPAFHFEEYFHNADEISCAAISQYLASWIPTSGLNKEQYKARLLGSGHRWIWHCLGLLMMAALPIRVGARLRLRSAIDIGTIELIPGSRNPGLQPVQLNDPEMPTAGRESIGPSTLYTPGRGEINSILLEQADYLQQVREALQGIREGQSVLSRPWLQEILRLHNRLETQRREIKESKVGHRFTWAIDWDFRLPDYDPELAAWENTETQLIVRPGN